MKIPKEAIEKAIAGGWSNKDVDLARYFIPPTLQHIPVTQEDERKYIEWSSLGKHKENIKLSGFSDGFNALVWGKKYAGINVHELWEPGVLEGTMPYFTLLGGCEGTRKKLNPIRLLHGDFYHKPIPRFVVNFMKKEMFKGADAEIIESCYQSLLTKQ